jgi:hypothetical protein
MVTCSPADFYSRTTLIRSHSKLNHYSNYDRRTAHRAPPACCLERNAASAFIGVPACCPHPWVLASTKRWPRRNSTDTCFQLTSNSPAGTHLRGAGCQPLARSRRPRLLKASGAKFRPRQRRHYPSQRGALSPRRAGCRSPRREAQVCALHRGAPTRPPPHRSCSAPWGRSGHSATGAARAEGGTAGASRTWSRS